MPITRRQTLLLGAALVPALATRRALGADAGELRLFAGQLQGSGHADGAGAQASFFDPRGLARDPRNGDIVVADAANALLRRITPQGVVSTLAGAAEQRSGEDGPAAQARFAGPDAVAVAPDGTIYIADSYANTIRVLRDGLVSTLAGSRGQPGFADGHGGAAQFNHPVGLAVDPRNGDLLIADAYNSTLRRIRGDGSVTTFGGQPGVAEHRDGALAQALFNTPVGIAVAADGTIYVSEYFNHDLRRISPQGRVETLAGSPGEDGDLDGQGAAARLRKPQQICLDTDGSILLAEGGNQKVRRISVEGRVTTLAGSADVNAIQTGALPGALITPYGVAPGPDGSVLVSSGEAILQVWGLAR
jgi:DNA-binding beta-propeller fold protein YncE